MKKISFYCFLPDFFLSPSLILKQNKTKQYQSRVGCDPLFLGIVKVEEPDVRGLNILRELTESVLSIPVNSTLVNDAESGSVGRSTIYLELL